MLSGDDGEMKAIQLIFGSVDFSFEAISLFEQAHSTSPVLLRLASHAFRAFSGNLMFLELSLT